MDSVFPASGGFGVRSTREIRRMWELAMGSSQKVRGLEPGTFREGVGSSRVVVRAREEVRRGRSRRSFIVD